MKNSIVFIALILITIQARSQEKVTLYFNKNTNKTVDGKTNLPDSVTLTFKDSLNIKQKPDDPNVIYLSAAAPKKLMNVKLDVGIYKTIDGKIIPLAKLDSVIKSFNGPFNVTHKPDEPGVTYFSAETAAELKEQRDVKNKLEAMVGKPAPDFLLNDMNGKQRDLASMKGKVVVLNFWFINCGACIEEMPELNAVKQSFEKDDVSFLALAIDKKDKIIEFQKTHRFDYEILPDAKSVFNTYSISYCPTSVVIGKDGLIKAIIGFEEVKTRLTAAIKAAL